MSASHGHHNDAAAQREESDSPPAEHDIASALRATREQDRRKGKAVARQITLWDSLLDARIRLQKATTALNSQSMPQLQALATNPSVKEGLDHMVDEAIELSEDIFTLQETLLRTDGTTSPPPPRKRAKISHDPERDYSGELRNLSKDLSTLEASYHSHLVQTLAKWSAKIQAVAPTVLLPAVRSSFKGSVGSKAATPGVIEVIDSVLQTDAQKLLARTQSTRNSTSEDPASDIDAQDSGIFDDTDFYQQLLRDVIESRADVSGTGEQEWMQRQKALKAKRKKTIDTRASKGRKLRYQVHDKLQNFMVPIPTGRGAWHEEQIDELFASLMGAQKSSLKV